MDESIALVEFSKHGRRACVETVAYAHIEVGWKIWFPHRLAAELSRWAGRNARDVGLKDAAAIVADFDYASFGRAEAAPPPPAPAAGERTVMTGALEKHSRRTIFAHWRRCTLREDGVFLWAKVEGDGRVLGSVSVVGGRVEKVDHDSLDFKVTRENGNWFRFVAKTAAEADKWVYLLEKAARGDAAPPTPPCKKRGVNGVPRRYSSPRL